MAIIQTMSSAGVQLGALGQAGLGLRSAGVITPLAPAEVWRITRGLVRGGRSPAALLALSAGRYPERTAVIDERASITYAELNRQVEAVAAALSQDYGLVAGDSVAVMARNHIGLLVAMFAVMRLGCDLVLLNTEFPAPQLKQVLTRHDFAVAIHDQEFDAAFVGAEFSAPRILAWQDQSPKPPADQPSLATLAEFDGEPAPRAAQFGQIIILTSGTTGTPKGANRANGVMDSVGAVATLLRRVPVRSGAPILIAPPIFHGFGLALAMLAVGIGAPMVIRRHFDAEALLADMARLDVKLLIAVPVMLQRLLDAPDVGAYDLSGLDAVLAGAAPLSPALVLRWMDTHGDKLYNGYGSTEVGFAALAEPADLRTAPGCVGRPPVGVSVKIMGEDGREMPPGEVGHIYIGSPMLIDGYVGGGDKARIGELMNSGDLGHFDADGRLYLDGRVDDMIVSGGENVYPQEIEDVLARCAEVRDVAVLGVPDEEFGQRLKAFVVSANGTDDEEALRAHLKAHVARFKMPREFLFLDELPRNLAGKLLKRKLAELGAA